MTDQRAADGVDHLQAAALELIQAARAFLDVAEEIVADRERMGDLADAAGSVLGAVIRAAGGDQGAPVHDDGATIQHIRVS